MNRILQLDFKSSCCYENIWPKIKVIINNENMFEDYVIDFQTINIEFVSLDCNKIEIHYLNKRMGPDTWDTTIDQDGNVIKDQNIILQNLRIDKCRLNFLINQLNFIKVDGSIEKTNGFMGFPGHLEITVNEPLYDYIQDIREKNAIPQYTNSSLPFITNQSCDFESCQIDQLLEQLEQTIINATNKDTGPHSSVFRTA